MSGRMHLWLIVWGISACLGCTGDAPIPTSGTPSLAAVRSQYLKSIAAIQSIDATFSLHHQPKEGRVREDNDPLTRFEIRTLREGSQQAIYLSAFNASNTTEMTGWAVFDGYRSTSLSTIRRDGQPAAPPTVKVSNSMPGVMKGPQTLDRFLGIGQEDQLSLADLLRRPEATLVGYEVIGGTKCLRIDLGRHDAIVNSGDQSKQITAWLDEAAGCVPRLIRREMVRLDALGNQPEWEWEILEFAFIKTPETEIVVPAVAVARNPITEIRYQLTSAKINEPIPPELFSPEVPEGTP
jgi:hypothetical protein